MLVNLKLHLDLIKEEFYEFVESAEEGDDANLVKEFVDVIYVMGGLLINKGLYKYVDAMFYAVVSNNLSKLGADGKPQYREDGKLLKPDNFTKLNPKAVIDDYDNFKFF